MKILILITTMLILTGCVNRAALEQRWEDKCLSYGFKKNTDQYASCVMSQDLDYRAHMRYVFQ